MLRKIREWVLMAVRDCIWSFAHFLVFGGLFLILNQVLINFWGIASLISEKVLGQISPYVPIISLFLVSISIYFEDSQRTPPTDAAKKFTAPAMIVLSIIFLVVTIHEGGISSKYFDAIGAIALVAR